MSAHRLFHFAYELVTVHVLWMWLLALLFIISAGWRISRYAVQNSTPSQAPAIAVAGRFGWAERAAAILFLLFTVIYIALIFHKEDFAYYDDDLLTEFSVRGVNLSPPVWPSLGRFYPLADQEFNLAKHFTRSPDGYHAVVVVQLLILLVILFRVLEAVPLRYRFLALIAAMAAPSFLIPFAGFVYPERNVMFGLAAMLLCLQRYAKTRSRFYFVGALGATHFALYYKETVVLFVAAYAVSRIFLDFYRARKQREKWSWREFARDEALPLGMLGVSAIYAVFFVIVMLPHRTLSYIHAIRVPFSAVIFAFLQIDWLPLLLLAVFLVRLQRFLVSRAALDALWDPLAVGALAYYFGVITLRINSGYYMAPVDLFALLYLARIVVGWLAKPGRVRVALVAVAITLVLVHDVAYSSVRTVERKGIIETKSQFADFLKNYLAAAKTNRVELYFPYTENYQLMGLASYLSYKGFQLEGQPVNGDTTQPRLVVESPRQFKDNRCVNYRDYACFHADEPGPGALIVMLPDDNISLSGVQKAEGGADSIFFAQGCATCRELHSWCRKLHAISAEFSIRQLPEHWLQLDVYQRRQ